MGPGARVSVRYLDADGRPTDVIGVLAGETPHLVVHGDEGTVSIPADAVVAVRELSAVPVRNSQIRAVEHAAALAWPGTEQRWHHGWLLRAAGGHTMRGNSAVPLAFSSSVADLPAVVDWYTDRGLEPWLSVPDRLLPVRGAGVKRTRVMVRDLPEDGGPGDDTVLLGSPDDAWLACYRREVPVPVLTAVLDGEVVFARRGDAAVGRGAVTAAPDGTRWLGISALRTAAEHRRGGQAAAVCRALLTWGSARGARRCYVQVLEENTAGVALYAGLDFGLHHWSRYLDARSVTGASVG